MSKLYKIELGCGRTKTPGFIGMDRFPLPGVDIVTDLNQTWPIEDNAVDVIFSSHFLEHLDSMIKAMGEMYRVCRHGALVLILAPYYFTFTNIANCYHKVPFNEDTFRFFSVQQAPDITPDEYCCPHAEFWGLGRSDNSQFKMEFTTLEMEFFYYKEYRHLSAETKTHLRRSMLNVCDQIYYVLAVNKSDAPFSAEERKTLLENAYKLEPPKLQKLRERELDFLSEAPPIMKDITEETRRDISGTGVMIQQMSSQIQAQYDDAARTNEKMQQLSLQTEMQADLEDKRLQTLESCLFYAENRLAHRVDMVSYQAFLLEKQQEQYDVELEAQKSGQQQLRALMLELRKDLSRQMSGIKNDQRYLRQVTIELIKSQEHGFRRHCYLTRFQKNQDLFASLDFKNNRRFLDGLILRCPDFWKNSILTISNAIPFDRCFEYGFRGYGTKFACFLFASPGARLLVEFVCNDCIMHQQALVVKKEGPIKVSFGKANGKSMSVRFRALDNCSLVRVLEITNRWMLFGAIKKLAYYLED